MLCFLREKWIGKGRCVWYNCIMYECVYECCGMCANVHVCKGRRGTSGVYQSSLQRFLWDKVSHQNLELILCQSDWPSSQLSPSFLSQPLGFTGPCGQSQALWVWERSELKLHTCTKVFFFTEISPNSSICLFFNEVICFLVSSLYLLEYFGLFNTWHTKISSVFYFVLICRSFLVSLSHFCTFAFTMCFEVSFKSPHENVNWDFS